MSDINFADEAGSIGPMYGLGFQVKGPSTDSRNLTRAIEKFFTGL